MPKSQIRVLKLHLHLVLFWISKKFRPPAPRRIPALILSVATFSAQRVTRLLSVCDKWNRNFTLTRLLTQPCVYSRYDSQVKLLSLSQVRVEWARHTHRQTILCVFEVFLPKQTVRLLDHPQKCGEHSIMYLRWNPNRLSRQVCLSDNVVLTIP